jgi:hypothetical protein
MTGIAVVEQRAAALLAACSLQDTPRCSSEVRRMISVAATKRGAGSTAPHVGSTPVNRRRSQGVRRMIGVVVLKESVA